MEQTDIEIIDACLREVGWRSTVYAHEITGPLEACEDPDVSFYILALAQYVSECGGDRYLHSREFLDALLDCRNVLRLKEQERAQAPVSVPS